MEGDKQQLLLKRKFQIGFFFISILMYLFFYVSAYFTHTLAPFFVRTTIGQDFFQIPNGAYAFLHGGSLTGSLPKHIAPYINCCSVNTNVYHPLFTLLVGIPLQFFPPWTAMVIWAGIHVLVMVILIFFLWKQFRHHKYVYLALSLVLLNSYNYYEIWLTQYQFLVNFFTILFLFESIKHGDTKKAGLWLFLSLLIKPIGLLWIIPLLLMKRVKSVGVGLGLYASVTLIFSLLPFGQYYIHNLLSVSLATIPTHNIYSIIYLIPSFPLSVIKLISVFVAFGLILCQMIKRPNLFTIVTLWTGYQLIFYTLVYHYQYTILAGLMCLGILLNVFSPKKFVIVPILFLTLPTPVIFFYLFLHLHDTIILSRPQLSVIWLWSIFWLCSFLTYIIINVFQEKKKFISEPIS